MNYQNQVVCPKCGSNQLSANKKGFSGQKAVAGAILTGGIGLLAGTIGSNKIKITCLNCGDQFKPGDKKPIQQNTQSQNSLAGTIIGTILALIFLIAVIYWVGTDKPSEPSNSNINNAIVDTTSKSIAPVAATEKKESLNSQFESSWRDATDGDEATSISTVLSEKDITCGDFKIRQSNDESTKYLCACRLEYGEPWKIYELWTVSGDVMTVRDYSIHKPSSK